MLRQQQIFELTVNIFVLRLGRFLMRQTEIPSAKDLVTIQVGRVIDGFNKRRSIRAQETNRYDDEQNIVQYSHGEEVSVW